MEILVILFLIVILVILINQGNNLSKQFSRLESEMHMLRQQLYRQEAEKQNLKAAEKVPPAPVIPPVSIAPIPEKPIPDKPTAPEPIKAPITPLPEAAPAPPVVHTVEQAIVGPSVQPPKIQPIPAKPKSKSSSDMEKFIGENLINKIGIAILVIGVGLFVKYAIDKNWVGEIGRVVIGIVCGGILLALAHRMRNNYKAFSSVLAGGGLAVFYFTITLAYRQFHLFNQPAAFAIMAGITVFAVLLSLLYNKQELAIIALTGGFASPLLVSSGNNNYIALFTYLSILNTGILVVAYYKGWRLLNFLAFIFTSLFFGIWLLLSPDMQNPQTAINAFIFATIFYLLFFAINIAHNIKENKKFIVSDYGILLANTFLYFVAGLYCIAQANLFDYKGWFSAAIGLFNLMVSYFFFFKRKVDINILYLLIGITLSFISLTAPLQLNGNYITLFWATEAVLLYWLYTKSGIRLMQVASTVIWAAMLASLMGDWYNIYNDSLTQLPIIANKGFITTLFAAVACYALFIIHLKTDAHVKTDGFAPGKTVMRIVALVLAFAAGAWELHHQFHYYYPQMPLYLQYLLLYSGLFVLLASWVMQKATVLQTPRVVSVILLFAVMVFYLLCIIPTHYTQRITLTTATLGGQFTIHWLTAAAVGVCFVRLIHLLKKQLLPQNEVFAWLCCAIAVIFISVELHLLANALFYSSTNPLSEIQRIYIKTGLPILWGLCSFVFMWLGMRHKYRPLRIISLTLFSITLFKLFVFDIRNIPAAGKIAAFFCLGVLLLVVSFMYQRLKKIIIEDEKNND